jgi:hypothetical protein
MMLLDLFPPLFAWSAEGHAALTSLAFTGALARLITHKNGYLFQQIHRHYAALVTYGVYSPFVVLYHAAGKAACRLITEHVDPNLKTADLDGSNFRRDMNANPVVRGHYDREVAYLFEDLPEIVVDEDVHPGNIPGIGEKLQHDSQVRHFMRSRPDVSPWKAYLDARTHVWAKMYDSWSDFKGALHERHGFWGELEDIAGGVVGARGLLFRSGLEKLGAALHTLEDSYAPGHVQRGDDGVIEDVHIWDDENRNRDDSKKWEGHHAYDEPDNPKSNRFYLMAQDGVAEVIFTVLSTLDGDDGAYRTAAASALNDVFPQRIRPS